MTERKKGARDAHQHQGPHHHEHRIKAIAHRVLQMIVLDNQIGGQKAAAEHDAELHRPVQTA